jgi:hypothetical protein
MEELCSLRIASRTLMPSLSFASSPLGVACHPFARIPSMEHKLVCPACDFEFEDDGFSLDCPRPHAPALLTTRYASRTLEFDPHATGAIAAHEAAKRLVEDGRFGSVLPRLMLAQNAPFAPIHASWLAGGRKLVELDPAAARALAQGIVAKVLSNRLPPYCAAGGLFDVLCESQGDVFAVHNEEVTQSLQLFEKCEGSDIDPAAGVALAALAKAVRAGQVRSQATILLHITGGGALKRASEQTLSQAPPDLEISLQDLNAAAALEKVCALFANQTLRA